MCFFPTEFNPEVNSTDVVWGENWLPQDFLCPLHLHYGICTHTLTVIKKNNQSIHSIYKTRSCVFKTRTKSFHRNCIGLNLKVFPKAAYVCNGAGLSKLWYLLLNASLWISLSYFQVICQFSWKTDCRKILSSLWGKDKSMPVPDILIKVSS